MARFGSEWNIGDNSGPLTSVDAMLIFYGAVMAILIGGFFLLRQSFRSRLQRLESNDRVVVLKPALTRKAS